MHRRLGKLRLGTTQAVFRVTILPIGIWRLSLANVLRQRRGFRKRDTRSEVLETSADRVPVFCLTEHKKCVISFYS